MLQSVSLNIEKMKIGILTLPLHTNYGGILQAYALQTVLERMGHEVTVIDEKRKPKKQSILLQKKKYIGRFFKKYILRKSIYIHYEKKMDLFAPIICKYTNAFIDEYINRLQVNKLSEIEEGMFDAIVVGSDQIWRPICYNNIEDAFLLFAKDWNIRRIAYAPSFGVDSWEYTVEQTNVCSFLLKNFDLVTIREKSGVELISKNLKCKAELVLDPTLLLNKDDYVNLINRKKIRNSKGNLFNYILDHTLEKQELITKIAKDLNLFPFKVNGNNSNDTRITIDERIQRPVEDWIQGIMDADFIITDSFHACVFCIVFQKSFVVLQNKKRGLSRIESLLGLFGLERLMISSFDEYKDLNTVIDYDQVSQVLLKMRESNIEMLQSSLK